MTTSVTHPSLQRPPSQPPQSNFPPGHSIDAEDAWLLTVMRKPTNRAMLASLENALAVFVADNAKQSLPFPPKGDFYRKVCRAVALRFHLACHVEPVAGVPPTENAPMRLVLVKTPDSAVPAKRLAELSDELLGVVSGTFGAAPGSAPEATSTTLSVMRAPVLAASSQVPWGPDAEILPDPEPKTGPSAVLRRPPTDPSFRGGSRFFSLSGPPGSGSVKNVTEEEYETARARIFQETVASGDPAVEVDVGGIESSLRQISVAGGLPVASSSIVRVAEGPVDGSIGFGPRRQERQQDTSAPGGGTGEKAEGYEGPSRDGQSGRGGRRSTENAVHEADRHDPDFDRRYSKWQAPPSSMPLHHLYAMQNPGSNFSQHQAGGIPLLQQTQQDMTYQSMIAGGMQHQTLNSHVPAMQAGHAYSGFPNHQLGTYGQVPPSRMGQPSVGLSHNGNGLGTGLSPYPLQMTPTVATVSGSSRLASMWLPSHTPQGEAWREQGFCVEPHVAKSSGVLRPAPKPEAFVDSQHPPPAQYGLNSLNDFPKLSNAP